METWDSCSYESRKIFYGKTEHSSKELVQSYFLNLLHLSVDEREYVVRTLEVGGDLWFAYRCGLFKNGEPAEYAIKLCEMWKLSEDAKFLAIDIFNRFISEVVCSIYKLTHNENMSLTTTSATTPSSIEDDILTQTSTDTAISDTDEEWLNSLYRLKDQMLLRLVSSITIASKMCANYTRVSISKCLRFLSEEGYTYSGEILLQSEMRILKALNYNLHKIVTPYHHLQTMLELLVRSDEYIPVNELHTVCVTILELYYINRNSIYSTVCNLPLTTDDMIMAMNEPQQRLLLTIMTDGSLVSCSIIASAAYFVNKKLSDKLISLMEAISGIPSDDVSRLASAILKVLFDEITA